MEISDIPNNMKFIFGPNLREVPISKIQMLSGMIYIMDKLKNDEFDEMETAKWNGILGYYLRIVGELEESEKHLTTSIKMYDQLNNQQAVFTNKLRLAHTHQWWTNYEFSNKLFEELRTQAETKQEYAHFLDHVYDHCGKNAFDQENFQEALAFFEKALQLRKKKDNQELINLSETAIEACEYRVENF